MYLFTAPGNSERAGVLGLRRQIVELIYVIMIVLCIQEYIVDLYTILCLTWLFITDL